MAKGNTPFLAFSGGEVGREVLARVDLEKYPTMAETMENFFPELQGGMQFRPGLQMLADVTAGASAVFMIPFVFSNSQKAMLLLSAGKLRVMSDGGIVQRTAVSSAITGGTFPDLTAWTNISAGTGAATAAGSLKLINTDGTSVAGVRQVVTTASVGVQHGLLVNVARGPVALSVGSAAGGKDLLYVSDLRTGRHSLSFTPTASPYYVQITSTAAVERYVSSIAIAPGGDLTVDIPWVDADYPHLRVAQSADVLFVGSGSRIIGRIERRGAASWSVVDYAMTDGPWLPVNVDDAHTLTPSAVKGMVTLTSSKALFSADHVGALFQLVHSGQYVSRTANGATQFTDPIKVTGVKTDRNFTVLISGTWSGTIVLQRSIGNETSFADYASYTTNQNTTVNDTLDNQIIYYRIGFNTSYTSGSAGVSLTYSGGSTVGVVKVVGFTSETQVNCEVVRLLGKNSATNQWAEGAWSDARGWPKGVAIYDGRLFCGQADNLTGSVSDAYESHDVGLGLPSDAIQRKVATGNVNLVQWVLGLMRLVVGTEGSEVSIRATMYDDPLTPSNFSVKDAATCGAANVSPVKYDAEGFFVDKSGERVYLLGYDPQRMDYSARSMMHYNRRIGKPGVISLAVARQPDPRLYAVRSDGQCLVMLYDASENVLTWSRMVTDGVIEQAAVLPGASEDEVYFVVRRTIGAIQKRYIERLSPFYLASALDAVQMDSWLSRNGAPTNVVTGAGHLEGKGVAVWADGTAREPAVVTGGAVAVSGPPAARVAIGLPYEGRYKSGRLSYFAQGGTALNQLKRLIHVSLFLRQAVGAIWYGRDFAAMDQIPDRTLDAYYDAAEALEDTETGPIPLPGGHDRDARLCLKVASPYPAIVAGVVVSQGTHERV